MDPRRIEHIHYRFEQGPLFVLKLAGGGECRLRLDDAGPGAALLRELWAQAWQARSGEDLKKEDVVKLRQVKSSPDPAFEAYRQWGREIERDLNRLLRRRQ